MVTTSNYYPDLPSTNFPDFPDNYDRFADLSASDLPLAQQYYALYDAGNLVGAAAFLEANPQLKNKILNADNLNKVRDGIISLQRGFSTYEEYLMQIVKYKGEWSAAIRYVKYDVVTFANEGAIESYMGIVNNIPIGTPPTNTDYFIPVTLRGEQGASGVGLSYRGLWVNITQYYQGDCVSHDNILWAAKKDNLGKPPNDTSTYWEKVMEILSPRTYVVTLSPYSWQPIDPGIYSGLTVMQTILVPGLTPTQRIDIVTVPPSYIANNQPQLWPANIDGTCYICAEEIPTESVPVTLSVGEVVEGGIIDPPPSDIVGIYVNETDRTVTYLEGCTGYEPARMEADNWNWGSWENHWLVEGISPCMLKNGVEQYDINPNNYEQKLDGSAADITSGADGDLMIKFSRSYIKIFTEDEGYRILFSRTKIDDSWTANAFLNRNGVPMSCMYMAAYDGTEIDGKLRSLSGKAPTDGKTIGQFRTLANACGTGYEQQEWMKRCYLQMLCILFTGSTDYRTNVGRGRITSTDVEQIQTGTMNDKGLCWGSQTTDSGVKFLGIENLWGNGHKFCDGFIKDAGVAKVKMCAPYNNTATGYTSEGSIPDTAGFINKMSVSSSRGLLPIEFVGDSQPRFYYDTMVVAAGSGIEICTTGNGGLFSVTVAYAAGFSYAKMGASLTFTPQ